MKKRQILEKIAREYERKQEREEEYGEWFIVISISVFIGLSMLLISFDSIVSKLFGFIFFVFIFSAILKVVGESLESD